MTPELLTFGTPEPQLGHLFGACDVITTASPVIVTFLHVGDGWSWWVAGWSQPISVGPPTTRKKESGDAGTPT